MIPENTIRSARTARNLTQADLAALSGVSEKTIRRIETGGRIRADNLRALCAALGLNADGCPQPAPATTKPVEGERGPAGPLVVALLASVVLLAPSGHAVEAHPYLRAACHAVQAVFVFGLYGVALALLAYGVLPVTWREAFPGREAITAWVRRRGVVLVECAFVLAVTGCLRRYGLGLEGGLAGTKPVDYPLIPLLAASVVAMVAALALLARGGFRRG